LESVAAAQFPVFMSIDPVVS